LQPIRNALVSGCLVAAAALTARPVAVAREQTSTPAGWPCGARIDPTFVKGAEATGGQVFLLAPDEMVDPAVLLPASGDHPQTIYRLAGAIDPGVNEIRVPIDSSVESVVFVISVQCLQTAEVARPSGAPLAAGEGVTLSNSRALRTMTVKRPEPGLWTLRVAGSGNAAVVVQARSALDIADVQFAIAGSTAFTRVPHASVENAVIISLSAPATDVRASIVDGAFRRVAQLPLTIDASTGWYVARFIPGVPEFRVLVEGKDASGVTFQRVQAPLLIPPR
jgi:hypothetical protein